MAPTACRLRLGPGESSEEDGGVRPAARVLQGGMEATAAPAAAPASPSQLWRLSGRRSRKAASPDIFRGVHLRQLQRLFRRSGDQQAEQRAQLVWGRSDAAGLAQALTRLRGRSRRSKRGSEGALGPKWLHAFGHLRINEDPAGRATEDDVGESETELTSSSCTDTTADLSSAGQKDKPPADRHLGLERQQTASLLRNRGGAVKQEAKRDPERYLHRILY
ncbi:arginine vasopressin-induced protein 1 isoform X1 [Lepisosteus oculatus]|uniref:arginine vasopressin-induced protein 1 isoform X1 n=2 Tax=Lepisosteus oculatus TaxID=7918 RepID=UPI003718FDE8